MITRNVFCNKMYHGQAKRFRKVLADSLVVVVVVTGEMLMAVHSFVETVVPTGETLRAVDSLLLVGPLLMEVDALMLVVVVVVLLGSVVAGLLAVAMLDLLCMMDLVVVVAGA